MKKTLAIILFTLLFNSITAYADNPVEKQIEAYLSKKTPIFNIKGGGIDSVKAYVRMFQPKYRLKGWTSSYDPKTTITTFKVEYYNGNQNTAIPDAIVKSPEELKKTILDYTLGKPQQIIYLTTNNTLDPTIDSMYIIKLDYPVSDWSVVRKTIADISFLYKGFYRNALPGVLTKYSHEYLPVTVNHGHTPEWKAVYDNYAGQVINDIKTTSRSPYEMVYKWFVYSYDDKYRYDCFAYLDEKGAVILTDYGVASQTGQQGGLTWYVLGELGFDILPSINIMSGQFFYYEIEINGEQWYLDYPSRHFVRVKDYPEYNKIREWNTNMIFDDEIKTYEQFKQRFNIKE